MRSWATLLVGMWLVGAGTTHAASPCERTDRVYEVRTCLRIQERYQKLSGPSLAQPAQQTGSALPRRGKPLANYVDAGVTLRKSGKRLWVSRIKIGSPAAMAGMQAEDDILELDGQPVGSNISPEQLAAKLGGKEGTQIVITLGRRNVGEIQAILVRERIQREDASATMQGRVAVLTLRSFSHDAAQRIRTMITTQTQTQNPRGVVLDVRSNPGGQLEPLLSVLGFLLPEDSTIATLQTATSASAVRTEGKPLLPLDTPVVVLVSSNPSPGVALLVGALKTAGTKPVTVVLTEQQANDTALLTLRANGVLRLFRAPADAFLLPKSEARILFDAQYVHGIADIVNPPPDATNDPALSYAIDLLN